MPKRKIVEASVPVAAEPKRARSASKPKASAATHKRATKNIVEHTDVTPELNVKAAPLALAVLTTQNAEFSNAKSAITAEAIAELAYSYWEARSYKDGSPEHDWLRAEQELRVKN